MTYNISSVTVLRGGRAVYSASVAVTTNDLKEARTALLNDFLDKLRGEVEVLITYKEQPDEVNEK